MSEKNPAAVALGSARSAKKSESSRQNGKRGGRPKKLFDVTFGGTHGDGQFRPVVKSVWKQGDTYRLYRAENAYAPAAEDIFTREDLHELLKKEARDYWSEKWAALGFEK